MTHQSYFIWQDRYSVGHAALDAEHQCMFTLLNNLYTAFQNGQTREALAVMFREAARYAETHFVTEELVLEQAGYPHLAVHQAKHRAYEAEIEVMRQRFDHDGEQDAAALFLFLKDWWLNHILLEDLEYAPFLAAHA